MSQLQGIVAVDDAELAQIEAAIRQEAYDPALDALGRMIATLQAQLQGKTRSRSGHLSRCRDALLDLHAVRGAIEEIRFDRLLALLGAVRESLQRLRASETTRQALDLASAEAARSCGLSRVMVFRAEGNILHPRGIHWTHDHALMDEIRVIAAKRPPVLDPRDRETQLLRRRTSVIVNAEAAYGLKELVEVADSFGYVAAPLVVGGGVVGSIHGDRHLTGQPVDTVNRDLLAMFADGVSAQLERTTLLDRLRDHSRRLRELLSEGETTLDELMHSGGEIMFDERGEIEALATPRQPLTNADTKLRSLLTARELEVIELMAAGASNSEIAARLVISETTVKSHVRQILRKMHASNRAQAAARYARLTSSPS
jgi:DNA-binding CsgD family transcriptional regulator